MRAREILQESNTYNQDLQSDLINLLVGAKASGATELDTRQVAQQLYQMGYSIDNNSLVPLLSTVPVVLNATPEMINLTPPEGMAQPEGQEDSEKQVSDMAQAANPLG